MTTPHASSSKTALIELNCPNAGYFIQTSTPRPTVSQRERRNKSRLDLRRPLSASPRRPALQQHSHLKCCFRAPGWGPWGWLRARLSKQTQGTVYTCLLIIYRTVLSWHTFPPQSPQDELRQQEEKCVPLRADHDLHASCFTKTE